MSARPDNNPIVTVCASGPSMTRVDAERAHDRSLTIVINETWKLLPCADYLYAADADWWVDRAPSADEFRGARLSQTVGWRERSVDPPPFKYKLIHGHAPPCKTTGTIYSGSNSSFQAMQIAILMGARRVVLLGLDLSVGPDGQSHWHGDYDDPKFNRASPYSLFAERFSRFANLYGGPCEIVNASRQTALTCFPRVSIEEAYNG